MPATSKIKRKKFSSERWDMLQDDALLRMRLREGSKKHGGEV